MPSCKCWQYLSRKWPRVWNDLVSAAVASLSWHRAHVSNHYNTLSPLHGDLPHGWRVEGGSPLMLQTIHRFSQSQRRPLLGTWHWDAGAIHKGRVALRIYFNHPSLWPLCRCPNFMSTYNGLAPVYHSVIIVGAFSVIVKYHPPPPLRQCCSCGEWVCCVLVWIANWK